MSHHPAFGPMTPEEMQAAIEAPYGKAQMMLRKHDPLWGLAPGEKVRFKARFTREVRESGVAFVMATSAEEAAEIANELPAHEIYWAVDADYDEAGEFLDVEIVKR